MTAGDCGESETNRIYVANTHSNNVTVIDGKTPFLLAFVAAGDGPYSVAVNRVTNDYVANRMSAR